MDKAREKGRGLDALFLTEKDELCLTAKFVDAFPGLRFVERDYWKDHSKGRWHYPKRPEQPLKYYSGLADAQQAGILTLWIEPDGWQPDWYSSQKLYPGADDHPEDAGQPIRYFLRNPPQLQIDYHGGSYGKNRIANGWLIENFNRDPVPPVIALRGGAMTATFAEGDTEKKRFIDKAFRIVKKFATNELVAVNPYTNRFLGPPMKGGWQWAGPDAIAWCRLSPHHLLGGDSRPADEYDPEYLEELDEEELWRARWRMGWLDTNFPIGRTGDGNT